MTGGVHSLELMSSLELTTTVDCCIKSSPTTTKLFLWLLASIQPELGQLIFNLTCSTSSTSLLITLLLDYKRIQSLVLLIHVPIVVSVISVSRQHPEWSRTNPSGGPPCQVYIYRSCTIRRTVKNNTARLLWHDWIKGHFRPRPLIERKFLYLATLWPFISFEGSSCKLSRYDSILLDAVCFSTLRMSDLVHVWVTYKLVRSCLFDFID